MSFVVAVPLVGGIVKGLTKSSKASVISKTSKCAKLADRVYTSENGVDFFVDDDDDDNDDDHDEHDYDDDDHDEHDDSV